MMLSGKYTNKNLSLTHEILQSLEIYTDQPTPTRKPDLVSTNKKIINFYQ